MNKFKILSAKPREPVFSQIDLKYADIKIKARLTTDSTELDGTLSIKVGEGNFTWTEKQNIEYTLDRGILDEVREGDQAPIEIRCDFVWEYITGFDFGGTPAVIIPTVEDALRSVGKCAGWLTSDYDFTGDAAATAYNAKSICRPYAVDLEITYAPKPGGVICGEKEVITFQHFRLEQVDHDLKAGTCSFSGRCNVTNPTAVRTAQV